MSSYPSDCYQSTRNIQTTPPKLSQNNSILYFKSFPSDISATATKMQLSCPCILCTRSLEFGILPSHQSALSQKTTHPTRWPLNTSVSPQLTSHLIYISLSFSHPLPRSYLELLLRWLILIVYMHPIAAQTCFPSRSGPVALLLSYNSASSGSCYLYGCKFGAIIAIEFNLPATEDHTNTASVTNTHCGGILNNSSFMGWLIWTHRSSGCPRCWSEGTKARPRNTVESMPCGDDLDHWGEGARKKTTDKLLVCLPTQELFWDLMVLHLWLLFHDSATDLVAKRLRCGQMGNVPSYVCSLPFLLPLSPSLLLPWSNPPNKVSAVSVVSLSSVF